MRIVDILYSLPFIFFVIMLVVFFGRNFVLMFLAVGAVLWLDMSRIVRGQALSIKRQEYVQAAEALGVTERGILIRHIVPNLLGPVELGSADFARRQEHPLRQLATLCSVLLPDHDTVRAQFHR
jgi:ABC-type dipeptide/oligopeptide/nickel transport system permease subunit